MIAPDLPLIDLHRHLDGNVRLETILALGEQHGVPLPARDVAGLAPHVHRDQAAPGRMAFIGRFKWLTAVLCDLDACRRIARENVEDAAAEGLDYVELRFSPWFMAETHGLDPAGVVEAVVAGVREGEASTGLRAGLIGILSRTYGVETAHRELDALLSGREHLVALDLAGDEANFPAGDFAPHFRRARDAGLGVTVHAGEAAGPESIVAALDHLGAERIGHGIRAVEDVALLERLARVDVGLEVCLTSNVHTSTVPDLASHPLRALLDAGVRCCLNTDDPGISNNTLRGEYEVAAPAAGVSPGQARTLQRNALAMAFLGAAEKRRLSERAASRAGPRP